MTDDCLNTESDFIEPYLVELLHINDDNGNKLLDLRAGGIGTFFLHKTGVKSFYKHIFRILQERIGKSGTTALLKSSLVRTEQSFYEGYNLLEWQDENGCSDPKRLHDFVNKCYKELTSKGNNVMFLSIGSVEWAIPVKDAELKNVLSPLIIVPVKIIRSGETQPLTIEFVDDDIYFNPCFFHKLRRVCGEHAAQAFPMPKGSDGDGILNLSELDLEEYFCSVEQYITLALGGSEDTIFRFDPNCVALSAYRHDEMSVYFDIRRNKAEMLKHPLVKQVFCKMQDGTSAAAIPRTLRLTLPFDGVQEGIIRRIVNGENLSVQGSPGTGKTQTIANMIGALMYHNKRILFVSKKLSALAEVCNKMPQELQKYVLRLDYETEAEAAKTSPNAIHRRLSEILHEENDYNESQLCARYDELVKIKGNTIKDLQNYVSLMYETDVILGGTLFEALDVICRNRTMQPVLFLKTGKASSYTYGDYVGLLHDVQSAEAYRGALTANGKHPMGICPWLGIDFTKPISAILKSAEEIRPKLQALTAAEALLSDSAKQLFLSLDVARLAMLADPLPADEELLKFVNSSEKAAFTDKLKEVSELYAQQKDVIKRAEHNAPGLFTKNKTSEELCVADCNIPLSVITRAFKANPIFTSERGVLSKDFKRKLFYDNLKRCKQLKVEAKELFKQTLSVFEDVTLQKQYKKISHLSERFLAQLNTKTLKGSIAAKIKAKKLMQLAAKPEFTTLDMLRIAADAVLNLDRNNQEFAAEKRKAEMLVSENLTDTELDDLIALFYATSGGDGLGELWAARTTILNAVEHSGIDVNNGDTVTDLKNYILAAKDSRAINDAVALLQKKFSFVNDAYERDLLPQSANVAVAVTECCRLMIEANVVDPVKQVQEIKALSKAAKACGAKEAADVLLAFGKTYYHQSGYTDLKNITVQELNVFTEEMIDQSIAASAMAFNALLKSKDGVLEEFFHPLLHTSPSAVPSFTSLFEHSFYTAIINDVQSALGNTTSKFSRAKIEEMQAILRKTDAEILQVNAKLIAAACSRATNKALPFFRFLSTETSKYRVGRMLFKENAEAILSLARCIVASPATVSIMLSTDAYRSFDTIIVDEASQMPPQHILPGLFRAKQAVIVGDEWQMPNIRHFNKTDQETGQAAYEKIDSLLDVLKHNASFNQVSLRSHYRSKTESLILYSQRHYSQMLTFPAAVPVSEDIGLKDCYVADGGCMGGRNEREAQEVVRLLNEHFLKNYDKETKTLRCSVGIVAFGLAQAELITKKIAEDAALSQNIAHALLNFEDAPEKLFFIRTIETVQGQETDHLILSMTYGKDENGKVNARFGQLNQTELGKRIFNVAVSRAKSKVSVVHSVRADEIKETSGAAYIADYLKIVEYFNTNDQKSQYVTQPQQPGFVSDVVNHLVTLGVSRDRIAVGYGASDKSLKIPITILSTDYSHAVAGIMCETKPQKGIHYVDLNVKYYDVLKSRGWTLFSVYLYDWVTNHEAEQKKLNQFIADKIKL